MSDENNNPEEQSSIAKVELPKDGFRSNIPSYLLEGKTDAEAFILTEISKFNHYAEWSSQVLIDSNLQQRKTNGRLKKVEAWREMLSNWKVMIFAIVSCLGGLVVTAIEIYKIFHP